MWGLARPDVVAFVVTNAGGEQVHGNALNKWVAPCSPT
jgi:hypothetical protein